MSAAEELGYRIPEDLAIVGFDDIPTARYLHPPLTTVNQAIYEQGAKAVELLLQRIADPDSPAEVLFYPDDAGDPAFVRLQRSLIRLYQGCEHSMQRKQS